MPSGSSLAQTTGLHLTSGGGLPPPGGRSGANRFASKPVEWSSIWLLLSLFAAMSSPLKAETYCQQLDSFGEICANEKQWPSARANDGKAVFSRRGIDGQINFSINAAKRENEPDADELDAFNKGIAFFENDGVAWIAHMMLKDANGELVWSGRKQHDGLDFMRVVHRFDEIEARSAPEDFLMITDVYLLDIGWVQIVGAAKGVSLDQVQIHADELHTAINWAESTRNLKRRQ